MIRSKYSATVAFSWPEDKDGTNKQTVKNITIQSKEFSHIWNRLFQFTMKQKTVKLRKRSDEK